MSRGIAPLILNLCTTWRWVVSITARLPCPGESSRGTQSIGGQMGSRVCTLWGRENSLDRAATGTTIPRLSTLQATTYTDNTPPSSNILCAL